METNRRIAIRDEIKCNFCFNWIQRSPYKNEHLNSCDECILKIYTTDNLPVVSSCGEIYQICLVPILVKEKGHFENEALHDLEILMKEDLDWLVKKWKRVKEIMNNEEEREKLMKIRDTLWEEKNKMDEIRKETSECIEESPSISTVLTSFNDRTPLKTQNGCETSKALIKQRILEKCSLVKSSSKKSLKQSKIITKSSSNGKLLFDQENGRHPEISLFNQSRTKKLGNSRGTKLSEGKESKEEFVNIVQSIKTNIEICLEEGKDQNEPLNIMKEKIFDVISHTTYSNKCIELVSYSLEQGIDLGVYLSNLDWEGVEILKLVKVGLTDEQFAEIIEFIQRKKLELETLVLTGNCLTEETCKNILHAKMEGLKNIYLGKNPLLPLKAKIEIKELKAQYNLFL